mmetsp:Transcript_858/g.1972  ORF Transcript_858/g.1972 Transcript_858/m.1972 type:complete len:245 (-) Transcript_858:423-1157(-)
MMSMHGTETRSSDAAQATGSVPQSSSRFSCRDSRCSGATSSRPPTLWQYARLVRMAAILTALTATSLWNGCLKSRTLRTESVSNECRWLCASSRSCARKLRRTMLPPSAQAMLSIGSITLVLPSPMFSWVTAPGLFSKCLAIKCWEGRIWKRPSASIASHLGWASTSQVRMQSSSSQRASRKRSEAPRKERWSPYCISRGLQSGPEAANVHTRVSLSSSTHSCRNRRVPFCRWRQAALERNGLN